MSPNTKWETVWGNVHLPSLGNDVMSFAWKLLHRLLTTEEQLAKIKLNSRPTCKFHCNSISDLEHVFFDCTFSERVGSWLISLNRSLNNVSSPLEILKLDVENFDALIWINMQSLYFIWMRRVNMKTAQLDECKATLTDQANILQGTKHHLLASEVLQILK